MLPIPQAFEQPLFLVGMAALLGAGVLLAPAVPARFRGGGRRSSFPASRAPRSGSSLGLFSQHFPLPDHSGDPRRRGLLGGGEPRDRKRRGTLPSVPGGGRRRAGGADRRVVLRSREISTRGAGPWPGGRSRASGRCAGLGPSGPTSSSSSFRTISRRRPGTTAAATKACTVSRAGIAPISSIPRDHGARWRDPAAPGRIVSDIEARLRDGNLVAIHGSFASGARPDLLPFYAGAGRRGRGGARAPVRGTLRGPLSRPHRARRGARHGAR